MEILGMVYRKLFMATFTAVMLICCITTGSAVSFADSGEYQVKAAMIFNMTKYMDWPEDALPASATQMTVCVAGNGTLGMAVDSLKGKQVKGKQVAVRMLNAPFNTTGCNILVFSDLERNAVAGLLEKTRSGILLTVADSPGFARSGGVVGFTLNSGKVRFEINQAAAQRHRIRISAQLLKLAQTVLDEP